MTSTFMNNITKILLLLIIRIQITEYFLYYGTALFISSTVAHSTISAFRE